MFLNVYYLLDWDFDDPLDYPFGSFHSLYHLLFNDSVLVNNPLYRHFSFDNFLHDCLDRYFHWSFDNLLNNTVLVYNLFNWYLYRNLDSLFNDLLNDPFDRNLDNLLDYSFRSFNKDLSLYNFLDYLFNGDLNYLLDDPLRALNFLINYLLHRHFFLDNLFNNSFGSLDLNSLYDLFFDDSVLVHYFLDRNLLLDYLFDDSLNRYFD